MNRCLAICALVLSLALSGNPVYADDTQDVFVCTNAAHAAAGAAAMRSLFLMDRSALRITTELKQNKQCWFETVVLPTTYTPLSRLFVQKGFTHAYIVITLQINGVQRYVVVFEEGAASVEI